MKSHVQNLHEVEKITSASCEKRWTSFLGDVVMFMVGEAAGAATC